MNAENMLQKKNTKNGNLGHTKAEHFSIQFGFLMPKHMTKKVPFFANTRVDNAKKLIFCVDSGNKREM